jgi:hypothetical protein
MEYAAYFMAAGVLIGVFITLLALSRRIYGTLRHKTEEGEDKAYLFLELSVDVERLLLMKNKYVLFKVSPRK